MHQKPEVCRIQSQQKKNTELLINLSLCFKRDSLTVEIKYQFSNRYRYFKMS